MNNMIQKLSIVVLAVALFSSPIFCGDFNTDKTQLVETVTKITLPKIPGNKGPRTDDPFLKTFHAKNGNDIARTVPNITNYFEKINEHPELFHEKVSSVGVKVFGKDILKILTLVPGEAPVFVVYPTRWKTGEISAEQLVQAISFMTQEVAAITQDKPGILVIDATGAGTEMGSFVTAFTSYGVVMFPLPIEKTYLINVKSLSVTGMAINAAVTGYNLATTYNKIDNVGVDNLPPTLRNRLPKGVGGKTDDAAAFNISIVEKLTKAPTPYNIYWEKA